PALVADDDLRRVELEQTLQTIVSVDDATIQIVQIAGRESTTVERNERTQIGRQHRDDVQHHPLWAVAAPTERFDDLEPLGQLLPLGFARSRTHLHTELLA